MYYESGNGMIVLQALMLTAAVFISLTVYTLTTKKDFSFLGAGLFAGLVILIVWSLLNSFFNFGAGGHMVFSLFGALLFAGGPVLPFYPPVCTPLPVSLCRTLFLGRNAPNPPYHQGYILYDTSQIMHNLGPDDYIVAAINLYLDVRSLLLPVLGPCCSPPLLQLPR